MSRINRLISLALLAACIGSTAIGSTAEADRPDNSNLDGELFYQILVSELSALSGDNGAAFALMLNSARKANSPLLYERAVEIALHSRSGESALEAAQAWARAFPSSREANRFQLQILLGLNRIAETQEPLKRELAGLANAERVVAIEVLPRYFGRTADKKLAATVVEKVLNPELLNRATGPTAWAVIGSMRMHAGDMDGALDAVRRGIALNAESEDPVLLAIVLMESKVPAAETLIRKYLSGKPTKDVRMAYARSLINLQRYAEAHTQMQLLTAEKPEFPEAWLVRGSLEFQDNNLVQAQSSLETYVALTPPPVDAAQNPTMGPGLVQAYLLLAQVAEQRQQLDKAQAYLNQINSPTDGLRIQKRHAAILARQGKIEEARAAIRGVPELQASDTLAKINAEVQLLREYRQFAAAYQLLKEAKGQFPDDFEIIYDLAMMAERLGKPDEMEALLRQVIEAKPDYYHAYNALGYSLADRNVRLPEARQLITKALAFVPDDPFITDSLGWVEFRSGNPAEALRLLKGAFQTRPDAEIAAHLGEVLWTVGRHEDAVTVWDEGLGLNPQNETLLETIRRLHGKP